MIPRTIQAVLLAVLFAVSGAAQTLSPHWEDLTSDEFPKALAQAKGLCILAGGIIEKHGPSAPMGADMFNQRNSLDMAARREYAIIFPEYYVGQIVEGQHQPGTVSYTGETQLMMLDETVSEMARKGCTRILVQGIHGADLMAMFMESQLESPRDYVVYLAASPRVIGASLAQNFLAPPAFQPIPAFI